MIGIRGKRRALLGISKRPNLGEDGSILAVLFRQRAEDGMVGVKNIHCAQDGCLRRPIFGMKDNDVATCCRYHAKGGMASTCLALFGCDGCSNLRISGGEVSSHCNHCAEDNKNLVDLSSSLQGLKQGQACPGQDGPESEEHLAVTCRQMRSMDMSDGRRRGERDNKLSTKRVGRGERNALMFSRIAL